MSEAVNKKPFFLKLFNFCKRKKERPCQSPTQEVSLDGSSDLGIYFTDKVPQWRNQHSFYKYLLEKNEHIPFTRPSLSKDLFIPPKKRSVTKIDKETII